MFIAAPIVKGGCQMMAQNAPQEPIVVDTPFVHDPVMAYENGKYYLYCTGHGITQMTSTDRKQWTIVHLGSGCYPLQKQVVSGLFLFHLWQEYFCHRLAEQYFLI